MTLFSELKRRNVFRLAVGYLAVSWLLIQIVETIFPVFGISDTYIRLLIILLAIGFPLVLIFAWLYELTPEGLKLDKDIDRSAVQEHYTGKKLDRVIMIVLVLSLGYFAVDKFVLDPARDAQREETAANRGRTEALVSAFGKSSIAVLPFINMSSDAEQEYFSDGISEELLNLLAKVRNLRVISRSSSFSYKGKDIDIPTVAAELNVAHVLEGSVRRSGNKIRITAQLIDARSDTHLWSKTYDRELDDIFAIQDDISAAIISELKETLGLEGGVAPRATATTNTEAHEAYLRGRFQVVQRSPASIKVAIGEFEKAVVLDPGYAIAYAELGLAVLLFDQYSDEMNREEAVARAAPHVEQALQLDPMLAEAQAAKGVLLSRENGYNPESEVYLERAVELNPNYVDALIWLASSYKYSGKKQFEKTFEAVEKAAEVDPLSGTALHAYAIELVIHGRLDEAATVIEKLASINSEKHAGAKAFWRGAGGNWSELVIGQLNVMLLDPDNVLNRGVMRTYLAVIGLDKEALAVFEEARLYTLLLLGRPMEAVAIAEARLAESPDSSDNAETLLTFQAYAGVYSPEIEESWEEWWEESPEEADTFDWIAMIGIRRVTGKLVDDVIFAMKKDASRHIDAGIKFYEIGLVQMGVVTFLEGNKAEGLDMLKEAAERGEHIRLNVGALEELYAHPGFVPILAIQEARQQREREKFLAIVCNDSPYEAIWQPQPGTCEAYAAEQAN